VHHRVVIYLFLVSHSIWF